MKVAQKDKKTGYEIQIFNDHLEAGKKLGIHPSNILACLKKEVNSAGGYRWEWVEF